MFYYSELLLMYPTIDLHLLTSLETASTLSKPSEATKFKTWPPQESHGNFPRIEVAFFNVTSIISHKYDILVF